MILHPPFLISARLLPALKIGDACLSCEPSTATFYLDTPSFEHVINDFSPGPTRDLQGWFADICAFMDAAGESREYRGCTGEPGDNEDLFPPEVVDWIVEHLDEIATYHCDLEEGPQNLIEP